MKDFFKYISAGDDDRKWGLYLTAVGKSRIEPRTEYPSPKHPTGYYFTWENGRSLMEYQINYITEGGGVLENEDGRFFIKPGTLMIIRPGKWHRYRPHGKSGWVENYVGFNGPLADHFLKETELLQNEDIVRCSVSEQFIDTYYKIFNLVLEEEPGFQQVASGMVLKLLGYIVAYQKQRHFSGKKIEKVIQKARFQIRESMEEKIDLYQLAMDNHVGYSYFRKMFKKYMGISPHQYHLEMKILRAKELLLTSDKSVKEISFELGFNSIHYFSRLFKEKVGVSPSEIRV